MSATDQRRHSQHYIPHRKSLEDIGSYEQVLKVFKRSDTDGNGRVCLDELHRLMLQLNPQGWSEADTKRLFTAVDVDGSGEIDIEEFVQYIFPRTTAERGAGGLSEYEKVMEYFRMYDTNRNGTLDKAEFTALMNHLKKGQWNAEWTHRIWKDLDADGSGEVDSSELVAYLFDLPLPQKKRRDSKCAPRRGSSKENMGQGMERRGSNSTSTSGMDRAGSKELSADRRGSGAGMDRTGSKEVAERRGSRTGFLPALDPAGGKEGAERRGSKAGTEQGAAGGDRRNSKAGGSPQLVLDIVTGPGASATNAQLVRASWLATYEGRLEVNLIIQQGTQYITKVCTPNGKVTLWDRASMIAFRDDPFESPESMRRWIRTVAARDIPRLMGLI